MGRQPRSANISVYDNGLTITALAPFVTRDFSVLNNGGMKKAAEPGQPQD
jgi:hypothetical protein